VTLIRLVTEVSGADQEGSFTQVFPQQSVSADAAT